MSNVSAKQRVGRPVKSPAPGQRAPLSLLVTPALKARIEKAATANGRTMAAECEALIEQGFVVADLLASMNTTIPALARRLAEKNFRDRGYRPVRDAHGGAVWLPPGHRAAPPASGFIAPEEEDKSL